MRPKVIFRQIHHRDDRDVSFLLVNVGDELARIVDLCVAHEVTAAGGQHVYYGFPKYDSGTHGAPAPELPAGNREFVHSGHVISEITSGDVKTGQQRLLVYGYVTYKGAGERLWSTAFMRKWDPVAQQIVSSYDTGEYEYVE